VASARNDGDKTVLLLTVSEDDHNQSSLRSALWLCGVVWEGEGICASRAASRAERSSGLRFLSELCWVVVTLNTACL
jgi:hypothetical protein